MFMYKELKKQKSNSKLQIGILIAQLAESEVRLKEVEWGLKSRKWFPLISCILVLLDRIAIRQEPCHHIPPIDFAERENASRTETTEVRG